ncbi:unnamed protein product, partial [Ectocarpus sp. 8 AP-2014]
MKGLRKYLREHHIKNVQPKLVGWKPVVRKGSKYHQHTYLNPDGQEFKTKGEVLAVFRAAGDFNQERQTSSREDAVEQARILFEGKGTKLLGKREPGAAPLPVTDILLENLGGVDTRFGFHSSKTIFPPGYRAIRMVMDGRTLRAIKARCSIYVENDAPAFRIELDESSIPPGKAATFEATTQKECFNQVFKALDTAGNRAKESVYGGPQFFNSAVKALIEGMPRSEECEKYVFAAMRGRGTVPMFKKVAVDWQAAAERAEEKMRRELEKSWWTGMPEAEK